MRPCGPEPRKRERSMPASLASRRASGVTVTAAGQSCRSEIARRRAYLEKRIELDWLLRRWAQTVLYVPARPAATGAAGVFGASAAAGAGLGALVVTAAPAPPMTATTAPTGATSPSETRISLKHAGFGRRHFHRHLVGLDLEQIVAGLHRVAGRLEPLGDLALGDGLAELRHQDVHRTVSCCRLT